MSAFSRFRPRFRLLEPWRTRLLWASLGANLFAGALLAAPLVMPRRGSPGPPGFDRLVERMAGRLPQADAERFRAAMERERPGFDAGRQRIDEARAGVGRAIGRTPFDPGTAREAFGGIQDRLRDASGRFDEGLIAALGELSPEGRQRLAAELGRRRP